MVAVDGFHYRPPFVGTFGWVGAGGANETFRSFAGDRDVMGFMLYYNRNCGISRNEILVG